jgi:ribonuclease VapC
MKSWAMIGTVYRRAWVRMAVPVVIDTSALLAILLGEPERGRFLELLSESEARLLSAANALETAIVVESRRGEAAGRELDLFLHRTKIEIVAVDAEQFSIARFAWRKYGKGRHPAGLNFGDCFAYALTKAFSEPLLAKGEDFRQTDLQLL